MHNPGMQSMHSLTFSGESRGPAAAAFAASMAVTAPAASAMVSASSCITASLARHLEGLGDFIARCHFCSAFSPSVDPRATPACAEGKCYTLLWPHAFAWRLPSCLEPPHGEMQYTCPAREFLPFAVAVGQNLHLSGAPHNMVRNV